MMDEGSRVSSLWKLLAPRPMALATGILFAFRLDRLTDLSRSRSTVQDPHGYQGQRPWLVRVGDREVGWKYCPVNAYTPQGVVLSVNRA